MITIETVAEIAEDGTLTVRAPLSAPRGRRRVVLVIDNEGDGEATAPARRKLPDLSDFRTQLGGKPYPGNSVVDLREEERS